LMNQLSALHRGLARQAEIPKNSASGPRPSTALSDAVEDFAKHILENPVIKPSSYQVTQLTEWSSWPLLWIILWSFMGLEWLLYRALGGK
ncbi:MAG: hypothetical protein ACKO7V_07960, partial [Bacteroidota bacterium]